MKEYSSILRVVENLETSALPADLQEQDTSPQMLRPLVSPLPLAEGFCQPVKGEGTAGPFYYASATEPLGDTVNTHLRTRCVLVAARRTGDTDSANNLLASHDRQRSLQRGDLVEVQHASRGGR